MFPLDNHIPKQDRNRECRSEAEHQLYWSTFQKKYSHVPAPRKSISLRMDINRWLDGLRKWWHESAQFVMPVSEGGSRKYPLIPKERRG
jgi:hypothetical protein